MSKKIIRRNVDHDHSCLFSSVAYLTDRVNFNEESSKKYRKLIVDYILNNEVEDSCLMIFDDLGFHPNETSEFVSNKQKYIETIAKSNTWGGQNEMEIFCILFDIQICVADENTGEIYKIGGDQKENRIYILWTNGGTHYDPLVINDDTADSSTDMTSFKTNDEDTYNKVKEFIKNINQEEKYDLHTVNLLCKNCNQIFIGKAAAMIHANDESYEGDHTNFKKV